MTRASESIRSPGGSRPGLAGVRFGALCIAAFALAACGTAAPRVDVQAEATAPPWTRDTALALRTAAAIDSAAAVWGGSGDSVSSVSFTDATIACAASPGPVDGCESNGALQVSILDSPCPEATSLSHEVGHAILTGDDGDPGHTDRRWCDPAFWDSVATALLALVPAGDENCRRSVALRASYEAAGRPYCTALAKVASP